MVKKMKLPFLFTKSMDSTTTSSWPWPTCGTPKTLSFRAVENNVFKTMNSTFVSETGSTNKQFQQSSESSEYSASLISTASKDIIINEDEDEEEEEESIEKVIKGLIRSERLFFEPGETSSSILVDEVKNVDFPFKESVAMAVDSKDPFVDFRRSMEEMVEAHGLKDWDCLEELLATYLRVNSKNNHGYIVGAFVDLLVALSFSSSSSFDNNDHEDHCSSSTTQDYSFTSPLSFSSSTNSSTSPCLSILEVDDEVEKSIDISSSEPSVS